MAEGMSGTDLSTINVRILGATNFSHLTKGLHKVAFCLNVSEPLPLLSL